MVLWFDLLMIPIQVELESQWKWWDWCWVILWTNIPSLVWMYSQCLRYDSYSVFIPCCDIVSFQARIWSQCRSSWPCVPAGHDGELETDWETGDGGWLVSFSSWVWLLAVWCGQEHSRKHGEVASTLCKCCAFVCLKQSASHFLCSF